MKKQFLHFGICCLFFLSSAVCSAQDTVVVSGSTKLVKLPGTGHHVNTHCGLQDKNGNLWFGTTGDGVYRYDGKLFTQFTTGNGLTSNIVYSMLEDQQGNIWFGTEKGLCRYDSQVEKIIPVPIATGGDSFSVFNLPSNSSQTSTVWSMLKDKTGKLWFGTDNGVYCYDGTNFSTFLNSSIGNKQILTLKSVQCMLEDQKGNIWFGSGPMILEGLCCFDGKSLTSFKPGGEGWIRYIIEDKNGTLFLGTRNKGIWCYSAQVFTPFLVNEAPIGLAACKDQKGNIWFSGTENSQYKDDGILWYYDGKSFKKYNTSDHIGNYSVWLILEDRSGHVWFGTRNTGLYRFDGKDFTAFSE